MSLFSDFLKQLGVPHTVAYSDAQFGAMPFQSLFGLSKLLQQYGIPNEALRLADKKEMTMIQPPFLADTPAGFLIVTDITTSDVKYLTQGEQEQIALDDFLQASNGIVLLAYPTSKSCEPDYAQHRRTQFINTAKRWLLYAGAALLFIYAFITSGTYQHISTILLTIVLLAGLWLSFQLVRKTLKIKSKAADKVCEVLEKGGCDRVMELKASSFFGIVSWSEVGLAYFSVSLAALLIFPQTLPYLALCNACCLPFTVWSIWYQKFRAKVWCTLCVCVQASLWLLFFCYLFGGWYQGICPLRIDLPVLLLSYLTALLAINYYDNIHQTQTTSASANDTSQL